jgi:hypothetical protein
MKSVIGSVLMGLAILVLNEHLDYSGLMVLLKIVIAISVYAGVLLILRQRDFMLIIKRVLKK